MPCRANRVATGETVPVADVPPQEGPMSDLSFTQPRPVASLDATARGEFVIKVYQHLLLAVAAFVGIETILFITGVAEGLYDFLVTSGGASWLLIVGLFAVVNWLATAAAHDLGNIQKQYAGLLAMAGAEALIFAPFLHLVFNETDGGTATVGAAAAITAVGFIGLTGVAFVTRKDLSFLRPLLLWAGVAALVAIVGAVVFGFELGIWFSLAMITVAGGSILYQTQAIMARYPNDAYVGAAVQLFGSVMLLFWYVLRLLMQLRD